MHVCAASADKQALSSSAKRRQTSSAFSYCCFFVTPSGTKVIQGYGVIPHSAFNKSLKMHTLSLSDPLSPLFLHPQNVRN